jgi:20S proteasome alpha/beta subunit
LSLSSTFASRSEIICLCILIGGPVWIEHLYAQDPAFHVLLTFLSVVLQKEEGMAIVSAAICAGIFNDLGSGSNVDLCIITKVRSTCSPP